MSRRRRSFRQQRRNLLSLILVFTLLLIVSVAALVLLNDRSRPSEKIPDAPTDAEIENKTPENETPTPDPEPEPEKEYEPATVSFYAVGDNLIHGAIFKQALDRGGDEYDFSYAYQHLKETVSAADIAVINIETVINDYAEPSHYPLFSTPLSMLQELIDDGFDVGNVASNHMLDKGGEGLKNALEHYQASPLVTSGAFLGEEDRAQVRIVEKNGIKFSFIGVTYGTNGIPVPNDDRLVINLIADEETMQKQIQAAKEQSDFVIVMAHWGTEYSTSFDNDQTTYAKKLADWGADLIIGHHPHVIEPIGTVTASDGREIYVAYSLGNFISAQDQPERLIGAALSFDVSRKKDGSLVVENFKAEPVVTHMGYSFSNIRVYRFEDYPDDLAAEHMFASDGWSRNYIASFFKDVIGDFADFGKDAE